MKKPHSRILKVRNFTLFSSQYRGNSNSTKANFLLHLQCDDTQYTFSPTSRQVSNCSIIR